MPHVPNDRIVSEDRLRDYALQVGDDLRLVQGAGGNLSEKSEDVLRIKASGTRFADAGGSSIFIPLVLSETAAAVTHTEDLSHLVIEPGLFPRLRPSIETALHALLPHRFVYHVHSTGAIAWGLRGGVGSIEQWFDTIAVPYAKPGVELARAVLEATGSSLDPDRPLAVVLINHGLVAAAPTDQLAARVIDTVQMAFAAAPPPPTPSDETADEGWEVLHPGGSVRPEAAGLLLLGALTPDEAVFLGPEPFTRDPSNTQSPVLIRGDGAVWVRRDLGNDQRDIASSIVDVARIVGGVPDGARSLTDAEVSALTDWEAEKWRKGMRR